MELLVGELASLRLRDIHLPLCTKWLALWPRNGIRIQRLDSCGTTPHLKETRSNVVFFFLALLVLH